VTINRSVASGNGSGFTSYAPGATSAELSCEECVASNNSIGFDVVAPSIMRVSRSTATNNSSYGFYAGVAAAIRSLGNNLVDGNGTESSGTITPVTAK
jgi:hypothetical protein